MYKQTGKKYIHKFSLVTYNNFLKHICTNEMGKKNFKIIQRKTMRSDKFSKLDLSRIMGFSMSMKIDIVNENT